MEKKNANLIEVHKRLTIHVNVMAVVHGVKVEDNISIASVEALQIKIWRVG